MKLFRVWQRNYMFPIRQSLRECSRMIFLNLWPRYIILFLWYFGFLLRSFLFGGHWSLGDCLLGLSWCIISLVFCFGPWRNMYCIDGFSIMSLVQNSGKGCTLFSMEYTMTILRIAWDWLCHFLQVSQWQRSSILSLAFSFRHIP